jgi:hypothetical protein
LISRMRLFGRCEYADKQKQEWNHCGVLGGRVRGDRVVRSTPENPVEVFSLIRNRPECPTPYIKNWSFCYGDQRSRDQIYALFAHYFRQFCGSS